VVAQAVAQARPEPSRPEVRAKLEPPALEWFRKHATAFAADVPSQAELQPFVASLEGARVVGLGEPTHGDHQSQLFKTHIIRELVRQGKVNLLMLELNRAPAAEFDAYVNEGKGDLTRLIMESGLFSIWRTDDFANLIAWLRGHVIRTGKPIRVVGVDCQTPEVDFAFALDFLQTVRRRDASRLRAELRPLLRAEEDDLTFYAWLKTQKREDYKVYADAATRLISMLEAHGKSKRPRAGWQEAVYAAKVGLQGLQVFELEFGPGDLDWSKAPPGYAARRDVFMAANLLERLGDGNAALWAHDSHIVGTIPPIIEAFGFRSIGSEVRRVIGAAFVSVGFAWTTGSFHARPFRQGDAIADAQKRDLEPMNLSCDRPGDLGEFLARVGPDRFYVDLRKADAATKAWGALPYYRGWCGWGADPARWLTSPMNESTPLIPVHDVLIYFRRISPSTLWKLPPAPAKNSQKK
jgi:erythromycin esterase